MQINLILVKKNLLFKIILTFCNLIFVSNVLHVVNYREDIWLTYCLSTLEIITFSSFKAKFCPIQFLQIIKQYTQLNC